MKLPVSKPEQIARLETLIARRMVAAETVLDRIERGGYRPSSAPARAIMRKHARMVQKINTLQTELETLVKGGN